MPEFLTLMCYPAAVLLFALVADRPCDPFRGFYFIAAVPLLVAPLVIITIAQM